MRFVPGNCCCEDAPTRTDCQYRSGTNGETVTDRPSVTIDITITGSTTPDCGDCDFTPSYTLDCGESVNQDLLEDCEYSADGYNWRRTVRVDVAHYTVPATGETGIRVGVNERLYRLDIGTSTFVYNFVQYAKYDDFDYTDCDGNPVTDDYGAKEFTVETATEATEIPAIGGSPVQDICGMSASATFTQN